MPNPTLQQRYRYWFDNMMSRGTIALIAGLAMISLAIICLAAVVITVGGNLLAPEGMQRPGFFEAAWLSLMRTLDAGTMGGDTGWGFRIVMLLVTLGGVFIVSALIGVLSNELQAQMERLRKGRSLVLENDHTLILGWSAQIFNLISELVLANESRKSGAVIVVLADQDNVVMQDTIRERIPDSKNTRIICRSGSPLDLTDLEIASPQTSRSIIILPQGEDPDTYVIKAVLAITNNPNRRPGPYHIVTQIRDVKNMLVVKMVGQKDIIQPILSNDLIARIVAQTSRQSGLSLVYTELMNFAGDEIYFISEPALHGKTYGEALHAYEICCVMGIRRGDGTISMNPPMDTIVQEDDQLFMLAEDDDKILITNLSPTPIDETAIQPAAKVTRPKPEKVMILGWNRSGVTIIRELDNYVARGSQVTVVSDIYNLDKQIRQANGRLANQKVTVLEGDIRDRALLEKLDAPDYDHIIVLAYSHLEAQEADAITLVTLLHLRDIAIRDETPFSIVSEMLDLRNRELAEAAKVDDFIVSEHLISLMMAQLSENAELLDVFADIFDPEGSEIYLKPVGDYIITGRPVNFHTLVESARNHGQTAIGYRLMNEANDPGKAYGIRTNPRKSDVVTFAPQDKIIVIAED